MKRLILLGLACVTLFGASGCGAGARYRLDDKHHDTVQEKLDAQWFTRDIISKRGKLLAVELVYCPMRPDQQTVCRTAVVWRINESEFIKPGS
jgi:hypothetical protein